MNATARRTLLRTHLAGAQCIQPISVFDPISARIASSLGLNIGMLAGSVASGVIIGAPDITLITLTELAEQSHRITRASNISLIVDADHGYGNALNVMRTVQELENANVSALTIEDTLLPEAFDGDQNSLISIDEATKKLQAALHARTDPTTIIIGRTSAMGSEGIEGTLKRIKAYSATGVDALFFTKVTTVEQLQAIHQSTTLPIFLGSAPPVLQDLALLASHGVRVSLQGHAPFEKMVLGLYTSIQEQAHINGHANKPLSEAAIIQAALASEEYTVWHKNFLK